MFQITDSIINNENTIVVHPGGVGIAVYVAYDNLITCSKELRAMGLHFWYNSENRILTTSNRLDKATAKNLLHIFISGLLV
jgi:hypothetical protein